jgi:hypothetical protein
LREPRELSLKGEKKERAETVSAPSALGPPEFRTRVDPKYI